MENQFHPQLREWAKVVIDYCTKPAKELNLEFYPLQSRIKTNPKMLIIGVNPGNGHGGNYESQSTNSEWEFKDGKMQVDRLLKGNPSFNRNADWKFFFNLRQINFLKDILDNEDYVYMNYFYFSTKDVKEMKGLNSFQDKMNFSKTSLKKLIDIINPDFILFLGTATGLDIISEIKTITRRNGYRRILIEGEIYKRKVYGIPHSSRGYSSAEQFILNSDLKNLSEGKEIDLSLETPEKFKVSKPKVIDFSLSTLNNLLSGLQFTNFQEKPDTGKYEAHIKGIKDDILDLRLITKGPDKYFSIRSKTKEGNNFYNHLIGKELYKKSISECEYERNSWLIYKKLSNYTNSSLEEGISNDIIKLIEVIKNSNSLK